MKNKINKKSTLREVLQVVGTELLREGFNSNIHVATTMVSIKDTDKVIITDVRFPNELKAIKDRGGICIRVIRHNHPNDVNLNTEHISESALDDSDDFDYMVINDGTIDDLVEKVKEILIKEKII